MPKRANKVLRRKPNYPEVNPLPEKLFHVEMETSKGWTRISSFNLPGNVTATPTLKSAEGLAQDFCGYRNLSKDKFRIVEWVRKSRVEALEQLLLRTLKCEFGFPATACPWWKAYPAGPLPRLVRAVPRKAPFKGQVYIPEWVCKHCLKANKSYKQYRDPIGEALGEVSAK